MADNTAKKIEIVKEEAEKEAKVSGRSDTQAQYDRTVERIEKETKK